MKKDAGFTLIEVIAVLVLVGILSVMAGFGIVRGVEGYLFAQNNTETTQKSQLALARMTRELSELSDINSTTSSDTAITFSTPFGNKTITLAGSNITLDGDVLTDSVYGTGGFVVTYFDTNGAQQLASYFTDPTQPARIDLSLRLIRPDVASGYLEFTTSVVPRNIGLKNAPTG